MSTSLRARSRCGWDRTCDPRWGAVSSSVVKVPESRGRNRKELRMVLLSVVQLTTMAIASSGSRAGSNSDNSGGGSNSGGGGSSDGGGYTPCAVPALNYWDTTRSMSQKENGCAAWNDGLSRHSYIMHAAASARWPAHVYSCANVQKKLPYPGKFATVSRAASLLSFSYNYRVIIYKMKKKREARDSPRSGSPSESMFRSLRIPKYKARQWIEWMSYFVI